MMFVIAMTLGESYAEFNERGFFIGTRDHFALTFPFVTEHDDYQIAELAERFGATVKHYSVEDSAVTDFIRDYGSMPEPVENETFLRQTLFETTKGTFVAPYCKVNATKIT